MRSRPRSAGLPGRRPDTTWGRALRDRHHRRRLRRRSSRRDPAGFGRHTSDTIWALVEKMLEGDAEAALVLNDAIEEGVSSGKTTFMKIRSGGYYKHVGGQVVKGRRVGATRTLVEGSDKVQEGQFAAVTPGRQIVLFGVTERWEQGPITGHRRPEVLGRPAVPIYGPGRHAKKGYLSRYKIGDTAEYDAYNLVYFGKITSITAKRVTIDKGSHHSRKAVLTIEGFNSKNWDPENVTKGLKRNREWSD